ncbi:MAG TPA: hypothetical protein VME40_14595 [Caulobacteraceae bacterium]|nr:hypothetical protein [Caulobacteraceae bacterium]
MAGSINPSLMLSWFQSFYGGKGTGTSTSSVSAGSPPSPPPPPIYAPTAPWNDSALPSQSQLLKTALSGASLFNPGAQQINMQNASSDYKNLFALYTGLDSLYAVANAAQAKNVSPLQLQQLTTAFNNGMSQLTKFLGSTSFSTLKLTSGTVQTSQTSTATTPQQPSTYTTVALNTTGNSSAVVPAFEGNVSFDITTTAGNTTTTIPIDLSGMGSTARNMANVAAYLNSQLRANGSITSFSVDPIPATPDTIDVGGNVVTVSTGQESWALQVNTNPYEQVSFSANQTSPAVYIGQIAGNQSSSVSPVTGNTVAPDATSQLLKFDTSGDIVSPDPPAYAVPGQQFTTQLGTGVVSVQATAVAPDGSVYVLADVNQTPSGAAVAGGQDVALMKYDSAGQLEFSTDLGSATDASGLSLAVSADGSQVAIAGTVTGSMTAGQTVNDPTGANSFVAVYDSEGDQVWAQQDDGLTPNQANGVAFGSDGSVYVTGQSQTTTAVQGPQGPTNSYMQAYSSTGLQLSNTQIATGGSNTSAGVAVDGSDVYVAGEQNGDAVVTEYDVSNPGAPTLVASRDLGNLQGGNVVGISVQNGQVFVAGNARGGGLSAGNVTSASTGSGLNAFTATLSTGLAPSASDSIAYYGGSGDTTASAMTVSDGDVWLTGSVTGSLPGEAPIGAQDGFVAALNPATGSVDYQTRFTAQDGQADPTSIAVAGNGASVLDQLGLPQGNVDGPVSNLITSTTSIKAGDSFQISTNGAPPVTVTIQSTDTFASLATEIVQATGGTTDVSAAPGPGGSTALEIQPATLGDTVKLIDGPTGSDALTELGLTPGLVTDTTDKKGVTTLSASGMPIYGLGLPATLDLSSAADIKAATVALAGAMSVVQQAYQNMSNAATPAAVLAEQKAGGAGASVPAYLTAQIASYQAALARLTAGQTQTVSITSLF